MAFEWYWNHRHRVSSSRGVALLDSVVTTLLIPIAQVASARARKKQWTVGGFNKLAKPVPSLNYVMGTSLHRGTSIVGSRHK